MPLSPTPPWPVCTSWPHPLGLSYTTRATHGTTVLTVSASLCGDGTPTLALDGVGYTAVCCGQCGHDPRRCPNDWTFIEVGLIAYLTAHLGDFHHRWPVWLAQHWNGDLDRWWFNSGNLFGYTPREAAVPPTFPDLRVVAYTGAWLWNRILDDLAEQHGGQPTDYNLIMAWRPHWLNQVWPHVPGFAPPDL